MNTMLAGALIKGAVEIFTNKKAAKENLVSKSSSAAYAVGTATALMPSDTPEQALTQIAMGVVALVLFFYRKSTAS